MNSNFKHTAENVRRDVELLLIRSGILCRVFGRGKDRRSVESKINNNIGKYELGGKLIQDAIGIRVALYFSEDILIVSDILRSSYSVDVNASMIDQPLENQFSVVRHNLIFEIPEFYKQDMKRAIASSPIDYKFEVQLRSVLSEGWHEVDHDLRYKTKNHWAGQDDLSRALNGILATLETSEWSMRKIFDDLAYRHYKNRNWAAMMHSKVRMRAPAVLSDKILTIFNADVDIAKEQLRINRSKVIACFASMLPSMPVTLDNVVFVWNFLGPKNELLLSETPDILKQALMSLKR